MATTYKDLVITPFRGDANNVPTIRFSSGDATSNSDMNVRFYATSNGALSFEGTSGQMFSITNDMTGVIYSVNDISGIPSIEVDANGNISMAHFGGNVGIGTSNAAAKLHVVGNTFLSGNTYFLSSLFVQPSASRLTLNNSNGPVTYIKAFGNDGRQSELSFNSGQIGSENGDFLSAKDGPTNHYIAANGNRTTTYFTLADDNVTDTMSLRRTTNPQTYRIYGTFTDVSNYERIAITANSTGHYIIGEEGGTGAARPLYLGANNTTAVTIDDQGRVGIGTTSPTVKLALRANTGSNIIGLNLQNGDGTNLITLGADSGAISSLESYSTLRIKAAGPATSPVYINAGGADVVTVIAAGNVGIGTNVPTSKLHVVGTANISSTITASGVDLLSNDYSTYLMAKGGIDGANTNITNLTAGLTGANTNVTNLTTRVSGTESNVIALQGGLTGANTNISAKDSIANVYVTWNYLNANITSFASYANTTFTTNAHVDTKIAAVIDSSPAALNTLRELANALGNDANFSTTVLSQLGTVSANTIALQGGLSGANTNIATKDSIANVYATYLMAKGGIDGANTVNTTQTTNITNLTTGLTGANTNITNLTTGLTGANTNITNLTTGLSGANTNIATKDSVANVYATYLMAKGGIDGANTAINLRAPLASPPFTGNATFDTNVLFVDSLNDRVGLLTTLPGFTLDVRGTANTGVLTATSVSSSGVELRANDYATYLMAKGGIDGANTNINNKAASYTVASHTTTTLNSYAIGTVVSSVNNTSVYLSGVYQNKNEYILANSSSNIQFKDASLVASLGLEIITIR